MTQIDEQTLRDIFNSNGLNYSQIVGDELTTVSMELQDFNYSLEQVLALIATQVAKARTTLLRDLNDCGEIHHSVYDYRIEELEQDNV